MLPQSDSFSGEFPVNFRTGKEADFPFSGVPYIGTGNGRIIRQQDRSISAGEPNLVWTGMFMPGGGRPLPIVGPVAELNLLFSPKEFLHRR